jgi:dsDNA-specific endonuclease/ATPase MutS2
MQLKSIIEEVGGLRFMVDRLDIQSGVGRRMLLASELMTAKENVEREQSNLQHVFDLLGNDSAPASVDRIRVKLAQIRDIKGTLKNLERGQVLDDIELFEVKHFAIVANEIREIANSKGISPIEFPNLEGTIALLDPDGNCIPSFYIYDAYSAELAAIRKEIKNQPTDSDINHLLEKANAIEDTIRERLSTELAAMVDLMKKSLEHTGKLDILIAKARQAKELQLVRPAISDRITSYQGIFNPQLKELLEQQGKRYQPVDISLDRSICLITGANMAGKTVMLKTVALSQYLCQLGFFVPAAKASVCLVNRIMTSIGDEQSELKGLSAFAAEILKISHIVAAARSDKKLLVLIDELARTTNPTEGKAIVSATANMLNGMGIRGIITTHYSGVKTDCHRLRVKGFIDSIAETVTIDNLSSFIDYSLVDDDSGIVPQEALRIASLLGVDPELVDLAKRTIDPG